MSIEFRQYLAMGIPVRDIANYLKPCAHCWTSGESLQNFMSCRPNHFEDWTNRIPANLKNPVSLGFISDFQSGELDRIFSVKNTDGKTSLMIKESLNKMLRKWDALLPEVGGNDFCTPNLALRCLYILEGLMWFSIDQYLDYLDEGGPVCVHSSFWGTWSSLGGMIENEPYLVYGGEWECLHEGAWDDPRKKEQDLHFMQTTQFALVGEDHVGFELLEPIFVG